jgi:predicted amidohydrolase
MELQPSFIKSFINADVFEAIGLCFIELFKNVPNVNKNFIAQYTNNINKGKKGNDRIIQEKLSELQKKLDAVIQDVIQNKRALCDMNEKLIDVINAFECPDGIGQKDMRGIISFFLIQSLDFYVALTTQYMETYDERTPQGYGPMNTGKSHKEYLVYLKNKKSFLSNANKTKAGQKSIFRKQYKPEGLGDLFSTIHIVSKKQLLADAGVPHIIRIIPDERIKTEIEKKRAFRIATIPYIGFETFHFHEAGEKDYCKDRNKLKGRFYVEYAEEFKPRNCELILTLLKSAIKHKANIVVFPEFIMSDAMRHTIKEYLKNNESQIVLVFAGSTYEPASPTKGNNVLHVVNTRGIEIATYYKYSPFNTENRKNNLERQNNGENPIYYESLEILTNPGKECPIFEIEGIGRVLPALCRDVIDGEYTTKLVELFAPQMVFIPAWSTSVKSFDPILKYYANTIHTASLLCNCCDAVPANASGASNVPIGSFCFPRKVDTTMDAKLEYTKRTSNCHANCESRKGCLTIIDISINDAGAPTYIMGDPYNPSET